MRVLQRQDLAALHEEADVIIIQQACRLRSEGGRQVTVVSDDTDVFLLLLYHYLKEGLTVPMYMESPIRGRSLIDIKKSVQKHTDIIPDILAGHALSGCDTTACLFGIGKGKIVKVLKMGNSLSLLGDKTANIEDINKQASTFINKCYGYPKCLTVSEARVRAWSTKMGRNSSSQPPRLCSLPLTNEAFLQNVNRAHLQTIIWKNALGTPPAVDAEQYGYYKNSVSEVLMLIGVPDNVALAPIEVLKLIKCSCDSETPCRTKRCGCVRTGLSCTVFCFCAYNGCLNKINQVQEDEDDEEIELLDFS